MCVCLENKKKLLTIYFAWMTSTHQKDLLESLIWATNSNTFYPITWNLNGSSMKLKKWSSFSKITFFPLLSKFSTFFLNPSLTYVPTFFPSRPFLHFLWPETNCSARKILSTAAYHCTLNDISNQILQSHFDEGRDFYIQDIPLLFALLYF